MKAKSKEIILTGKVKKGLGKGRFFISQKEYRGQFIKKLGIDPYYGTMNLKLSKSNMKKLGAIKRSKAVLIKGFKRGERTFGKVWGYRGDARGIKCALIIPERSIHTDIAEIIASKKLRSALKLKDGSLLKVSIFV